jgi:phosphatidylglycerol:prolipoprotein diacylglycerol transferase
MYPILLSIGRVNIYTHGFMIALGAIVGGLVIYFLAKKDNLNIAILFDLIIYSLLGGFVGARLLYIVLYPHQFNGILDMLAIWYGGLVSFGGLAVGLFVAWLVLKAKKEPIYKWFDIGIIGLLVGWAIGRIGCLLNGDSLGILSVSKIAIWGRIPTQLFESFWSLVVAGICFWLLAKKKAILPDGMIFWFGLGSYALGRFVIDFFLDENKIFLSLKPGQIGSIILFLLAFIIVLAMMRMRKEEPNADY